MPRPEAIEWVDNHLQLIEDCAARGLRLDEIASYLGIDVKTFYNHRISKPKINEAIERGKSKAHYEVANVAYEMATSKQYPDMTKFWLRSRAKDSWNDTTTIEHKGTVNIESEVFDKATRALANIMERTREVREVEPVLLRPVKDEAE